MPWVSRPKELRFRSRRVLGCGFAAIALVVQTGGVQTYAHNLPPGCQTYERYGTDIGCLAHWKDYHTNFRWAGRLTDGQHQGLKDRFWSGANSWINACTDPRQCVDSPWHIHLQSNARTAVTTVDTTGTILGKAIVAERDEHKHIPYVSELWLRHNIQEATGVCNVSGTECKSGRTWYTGTGTPGANQVYAWGVWAHELGHVQNISHNVVEGHNDKTHGCDHTMSTYSGCAGTALMLPVDGHQIPHACNGYGSATHDFCDPNRDPQPQLFRAECPSDPCEPTPPPSPPPPPPPPPAAGWSSWERHDGGIAGGLDAASWGPNRLDVVTRSPANNVWRKTWDGTAWSSWVSLSAPSGGITSDPSVVSWGSNSLHVFARGADNALWMRQWNGSSWSAWTSLGMPTGGLSSGPDAASLGEGHLDVFARGSGNALWHKWFAGGSWSAWESLGGTLTSDPSAVGWGWSDLHVFAKGGEGKLIHKQWNGSSGWSPVWTTMEGVLGSAPDASQWFEYNRYRVMHAFAVGGSSNLYQNTWSQRTNAWTGWSSLGGTITGDPGAVSWGAGRIDVFIRGEDNVMYHKWYQSQ